MKFKSLEDFKLVYAEIFDYKDRVIKKFPELLVDKTKIEKTIAEALKMKNSLGFDQQKFPIIICFAYLSSQFFLCAEAYPDDPTGYEICIDTAFSIYALCVIEAD